MPLVCYNNHHLLNRVFKRIVATTIYPNAALSSSSIINDQDINPSSNLINTRNSPKHFDKSTAVVYHHPSIISPSESKVLLCDIQYRTSRKRYEKGHWDSVISGYKEVEFFDEELLSDVSRQVISRIRLFLERKHFNHTNRDESIKWLPCHGIELQEDGFLKPHVDSVKFSGDIVAGLSLFGPSIMRLKKESGQQKVTGEDEERSDLSYQKDDCSSVHFDDDGHVDLLLLPSSLYVLSGESRYSYTHELLDSSSEFSSNVDENPKIIHRSKRISLIFRDAKDV